jgi:hypothetical protein
MVEVCYKARLGNNLFQYCLGRILAEELGFALEAAPIAGFPGTRENILGKRYNEPVETLTEYRVDFDRLRTDCTPRKIVLDGWFQRYEYFRPYRQQIQDWLRLDESVQVPAVGNELVLNVRRTDYVTLGWALPFSYYNEAIQRAGIGEGGIWIVTDAPSDPFFKRFKAFRPKFFSGSSLEGIAFMTKSRRLVLSQSTFGWWAAFLGNQEEIYAPLPKEGIWASDPEGNTVNLIERDRFVCIECQEGYRPTSHELFHQRRRLFKRRVILALNRRLGWSLTAPIG